MREGDSIKLFIGQVPRDWTEKDLRGIFEQYGEVSSLKVLSDKVTGQPKGCAFLTYFDNESAKKAQEELHEKRTLPGSRNPIQVKPAASEMKDENRKLYVGMLSRKLSENDVTTMFSQYGTLEDVTILKNADGKSRGCAFIKYETRQQAQNAIRSLHNSETMEGCSYPLVVKIADTDKDKLNKKRMQQPPPQHHHQHGFSNMPSVGLQPIGAPSVGNTSIGASGQLQQSAYYQQLLAQMALPQLVPTNPNFIAAAPAASAPGTMNALVAMAMQQQHHQVQPQIVQAVNQQPLHADSQASMYSTSQLPSSYSVPQVSSHHGSNISGLGSVIGTGISTLQNPLGGSLQSQLQSQLGGQLQSQMGGQLTSQLAAPLQSQLVAPLHGQLGGQLAGQLQTQLAAPLQSQLAAPLQSQLAGQLQSQLGATPIAGTSNLSTYSVGNLGGYAAIGSGGIVGSASLNDNAPFQQAYSGVQQYITSFPQSYTTNVRTSSGVQHQQQQQQSSIRRDGPENANLFIYQIPTEFNDADLMHTFAPFGNVLSAKVFVDKTTGASKGFGFVSYDNANSATAAINSMNGVAIGSKRLRVQHKRPRDQGKPY